MPDDPKKRSPQPVDPLARLLPYLASARASLLGGGDPPTLDTARPSVVGVTPGMSAEDFAALGDGPIVPYYQQQHEQQQDLGPLFMAQKAHTTARARARQTEVEEAQRQASQMLRLHMLTQFGADPIQLMSGYRIDRPETRTAALESNQLAGQMAAQAEGQAGVEAQQALLQREIQRMQERARVGGINRGIDQSNLSAQMDAAGLLNQGRQQANVNEVANFEAQYGREQDAIGLAQDLSAEERDRQMHGARLAATNRSNRGGASTAASPQQQALAERLRGRIAEVDRALADPNLSEAQQRQYMNTRHGLESDYAEAARGTALPTLQADGRFSDFVSHEELLEAQRMLTEGVEMDGERVFYPPEAFRALLERFVRDNPQSQSAGSASTTGSLNLGSSVR